MATVTPAHAGIISIPLCMLWVFIIGTYCPVIYVYFPALGTIRMILLSSIILTITYISTRYKYTNATAYRNPVFISALCFLLVMMINLPFSIDRGATFAAVIESIKSLIIFSIMIKVIDDERKLNVLLITMAACAIIMASNTIYTYFFNPASILVYRARALSSGLFGDPNVLALLLNSFLPYAIYFSLQAKRRRAIVLCGTLLIVCAIMLTFSRGGFLGLCTTLVAFLMFFGKGRIGYCLAALCVAILFWTLAPEAYRERISTIVSWKVDADSGTTGTRMDAWKAITEKALENPFIGAGANCSYYLAGAAGSTGDDWVKLHNSFLQVFVENGIFGLACYGCMYLFSFLEHRRLQGDRHSSPGVLLRSKIMTMSLMTYAICAFFVPQGYSVLLYTLTGVGIVISELQKKEAGTDGQLRTE